MDSQPLKFGVIARKLAFKDRKGARLLCAYRAGDVTNQSNNDSDAIPIDKAPPYLHFMVIARKFAAIGVKITSASLFMRGLPVKVYGLALHRETRETLLETLLAYWKPFWMPLLALLARRHPSRARGRVYYIWGLLGVTLRLSSLRVPPRCLPRTARISTS